MQDSLNSYACHDTLETERNGYNVAFSELGLEWYWDAETYANLRVIPEEKGRVRAYLETYLPHLLRAYDADFLVDAIQGARNRFTKALTV